MALTVTARLTSSLAGSLALLLLAQGLRAQPAKGPAAPASDASPPSSDAAPPAGVKMAPRAAFDRARSHYQSGLFQDCVDSYRDLFSHGEEFPADVSNEMVEQARLYYSSCLLALGEGQAAEEQMNAALRANPLMSAPDPVVFPALVQDLFFKVKGNFLDEVVKAQEEERRKAEAVAAQRAERARREEERIRQLTRLAAQESIIAKNERWMAAIPFGVGQFHNGDNTLGTVFLATEGLLLGALITSVAIELDTHAQAGGGTNLADADPFSRQLKTAHAVELASAAGLILTAGLGILEAQVNFVPEHRQGTRPRPLPKKVESVALSPVLAPGPSGATIGVLGQF